MKRLFLLLLLGACRWALLPDGAQQVISLAGAWDLSLGDSTRYDDYVMLPGSLLTGGKGTPVSVDTRWTGSLYDSSFYFNPFMAKYRVEGQMKFPFFLTPERHYVGKAWYRRRVYVPQQWKDRRVTLYLERPHIETTVYVNGQEVGHQASLSTPHRYDVTKFLKPGQSNELAICVYNGIENVCVGQDSHSVTDQTQGNWNGVVGRMELQAQLKKVNIRRVKVTTDSLRRGQLMQRVLRVGVELENHTSLLQVLPTWEYTVKMSLRRMVGDQVGQLYFAGVKVATGRPEVEFVVDLGDDFALWDEFTPNLYQLVVEAGEDEHVELIGVRDIAVSGRQLLLNGRPLFLRGTVENCCFPLTGYPPTEEAEWLRVFRKCKEYGLNHVRFHSYCPPEAAFAAADKLGLYLQPEGPSWPNHGVRLRRGMAIDQYLLEESKRIVDEYGHHPSFLMMAAGNEPAGDWVAYCNDWVDEMKRYDPSKLYAGASVGGGWAWDDGSQYHVKGGARGLDEWNSRPPSSDDDYLAGIEFPRNYRDTVPNQSPIVTHEKGQWCAFPDFKEISQYTGAYKARNFEVFRDLLAAGGMAQMGEKFLMASGKLQTLCYKYEIERNLRTPGYAGFQLLGLNDYSGQGTALVGPLNVFWREKGYVTADEWRQFCNVLVPLARFPRFVYTNRDTLRVPVEIYNAYRSHLADARVTYFIRDDSMRVYAGGLLAKGTILVGKGSEAGVVSFPLDSIDRPTKLILTVNVSNRMENHWDFWVYPAESAPEDTGSLLIADSLDAHVLKALKKGATVLLTAAGRVKLGSDVKQTYLPVFWNTSWFKMRPPHTTGAYIDTSHPLFSHGFPTDSWANLNWWELLNRAQVMNLRELPSDYQSPVQPIDTWHVSRKLGMIVEARVLKGRLLMTTMDVTTDLAHRPVARQMRQAIVSYMQSDDFQPTLQLEPDVVSHFYTEQAPPVDMFTHDSPDELKPKIAN